MVKCSFELVNNIIELDESINDYSYYLDIFDDSKTFNHYKNILNSRIVYLDNSAFERRHNGGSIDEQKFINFAKSIENDNLYVMIPDYFNDSEKTLESAKLYGNFNHNIFVPHGKNYDDYMLNAEKIVKLMDIKNDIIAVNFCDGVFDTHKRYQIIKSLKNIASPRIHVLGLKHPNEVYELKEIKDIIESIDTSLPVISTLINKDINEVIESNIKPKETIYNLFYKDIKVDIDLLMNNVKEFKSILN